MPSSKNAAVLVVISFLVIALVFSSSINAAHALGSTSCDYSAGGTVAHCCNTEINPFGGSERKSCITCHKTTKTTWACDDLIVYEPSPHTQSPPSNGTLVSPSIQSSKPPTIGGAAQPSFSAPLNLPPGDNNTLIFNSPSTGNAANPNNNTSSTGSSNTIKAIRGRASSPTGYCSRFATTTCIPCDPGLPGGRDNCILTSDWPPPSTFKTNIGPGLGTATNGLRTAAPIPSGNATNSGNTGIVGPLQQLPQTQQPPSPPPSRSSSQQQTTSTCPDGSTPDANGNCPTPTTTTNQQGGSASNNNNPTSEHQKGSNQPTQTGGQETLTKKHKPSKTDQGTTQSPS